MSLARLMAELKRRRVYRVAVIYAAAAFTAAQAADVFLPRLGLPDWTVTLVVVLAVAGFPVALILGWVFDLTPTGVLRTDSVTEHDEPERQMRWRVAGGVAAAALVLVAGSWLLSARAFRPPAASIDRLAVLPLANLTSDPEQEYFVDGVHDALIGELAQVGVGVIARTSTMQYRGTRKTVREIARELDVRGVIEGSVLRAGDSVRIQVQLIDGASENYLWAQTYEVELRDILALHRRISGEVAREIKTTLTPGARQRLTNVDPVNPRAYEAYLKGRFHLQRVTAADIELALQHFELALKHDPGYALAYVGIANVWRHRRQMGLTPPVEATQKARAAAAAAVSLDSTLAHLYAESAGDLWYDWDWAASERRFRRGIELSPDNATLRAFYSHFLMIVGRPREAMRQIEQALELDPLNPMVQVLYGVDLLLVRRPDEAIGQFREVLEKVPNHAIAHAALGDGLHMQQRREEALAAARARFVQSGDRELEEALERGHAEAGYGGAMLRVAEEMAARSRATSTAQVAVARFYIRAGDHDRAIEWLENAYAARDPNLPYVAVSPMFDVLRGDDRFQQLIRRLNLP